MTLGTGRNENHGAQPAATNNASALPLSAFKVSGSACLTTNVRQNQPMLSWSIGYPENERLEMFVMSNTASDCGHEWLSAKTKIKAGAFSGSVEMSILYSDLVRFHEQLVPLYNNLKGKAEFRTLEGQLEIDVIADRTGHIEASGFILDAAGIGNRLDFDLRFDQTILTHTLQELEKCISEIKHT